MLNKAIEARGHTGSDGILHLAVATGLPDSDVTISVEVRPLVPIDGPEAFVWPPGYFERVVGSIPLLERPVQMGFESRSELG
jgi:hypothetical protein